MSTTEPQRDTQNPRYWLVQLRAVWRDDKLPQPIGRLALEAASGMEVQLQVESEQYAAKFSVEAPRIGPACDVALARLAEVVKAAGLPDWETVSFRVDEIPPPGGTSDAPKPASDIDYVVIDLEDVDAWR